MSPLLQHETKQQGIPSDKVDVAVEEKIEEMGLKQYADRPAGGYSGGNKRKLSVAIAMIGDPQVLSLSPKRLTLSIVAPKEITKLRHFLLCVLGRGGGRGVSSP